MSNLFKLVKIDEFVNIGRDNINNKLSTEKINIVDSINRIVSKDIKSEVDLPAFSRSTVDGYAVMSKDTFGASESIPVFLEISGEIKMGENTSLKLEKGNCIKIATGAMMPQVSDSVVMVEDTEMISDITVEVSTSVASKENVVFKGEDIENGEILFNVGHKIRPQDIGALAGIGVVEIEVYKKPNITIFSTGDEIVKPEDTPKLGQIRDINSYSISAYAKEAGANVIVGDIVKDNKELLLEKIKQSLNTSDIILLSGGSSVGTRDLTITVLDELKEDSILAHGVAIKPGKPTILAEIENTLIIGLPGHPASSIVVFNNVVKPLIKELTGEIDKIGNKSIINGKLNRNIVSDKGRDQFFRVSVCEENGECIVKPILGKSSLISTLVKANGFLQCKLGSEGIKKDTIVEVELM